MKQHYSSLEAVFHNSLLLHFNSLEFQVEGIDCSLNYLAEYPKFDPKLSLVLEMLQEPVLVDCFDTSFLSLHPDTSAIENFNELPIQLKEALAEYIFEKPLQALSEILNIPIAFLQSADYKENSTFYQFAFMLNFKEIQIPLLFHIPSACIEHILPYLKQLPAKKSDISAVNLTYAVEVGDVELTLADFHSLEKGDVIIPDNFLIGAKEKNAIFHLLGDYDNLPSFFCTIENSELTFKKNLTLKQDITMQEDAINQEQTNSEQTGQVEEKVALNLEDIKVKVSFELERRTMTLAELQDLKVGTNILLESNIDSPVTLVIADKAFAKARVVSIDDSYAVQLTQLLLDKE